MMRHRVLTLALTLGMLTTTPGVLTASSSAT